MNLSKIAPWNWFKHEEGEPRTLPITRHNGEPTTHPIERVRHEMDRLFDAFLSGDDPFGRWPAAASIRGESGWLRPTTDISSTDREYTIRLDLPGVSKDDVKVELCGDTLRIRGERRHEVEDKGRDYHTVERAYGSFQRVLSLPADADGAQARAEFKDGVMTVTLPRKAEAAGQARQIDINVA